MINRDVLSGSNNVNTVYIHLLKKNREDVIDRFKFTKRTFDSYWIDNMNYTYESSNDNQCVMRYNLVHYERSDLCNVNMYNEVKIPIHVFPSTPVDYREKYDLEEAKINNRISMCIRNNKVYMVYRYSDNCDMDTHIEKIESIVVSM